MSAYDVLDRPIFAGDLLRTYHFQDRRSRRHHYLYHVVRFNENENCLEAIPYSELAVGPDGGRFWIRDGEHIRSKIIAGRMVDGKLFNEREKFKPGRPNEVRE